MSHFGSLSLLASRRARHSRRRLALTLHASPVRTMPPELLEISAVFVREKWRKDDDFCIALVRPACQRPAYEISVFVNAEPDELQPFLEYRFYGTMDAKNEFGFTFRAKTFVRSQPHSQAGIIKYLCQCPNIGEVTARALWNKFGSDAVRITREMPEVAAAALGNRFTVAKAEETAVVLREMQAVENCSIELMDLLDGRGFPKGTGRLALKKWGNLAPEVIKRNPHSLMAFKGCGFLRTDAMYLDLGLNPARAKRQALCVWHSIASSGDGHTWFPQDVGVRGLNEKIGSTEVNSDKALSLAIRGKAIDRCLRDGQLWIAEKKKSDAELMLARCVAEMLSEPAKVWPSVDGPEFSKFKPHQRERIGGALAMNGRITIVTGSPGTGKTFCAGAIVRALIKTLGFGSIAACAPTGKAAVRLTESLVANGVQLRAKTIHSLLKVASAEDGWSFEHDRGNPLPFRVVVVDEFSMCSTNITRSLLAACGRDTHLLIIGDPDQLPPIEHGAPLRDFITAGVPCGRLEEIQRNAGTIVRACKAIRESEPVIPTDEVLEPDNEDDPRNLKLFHAGKDTARQRIIDLVRKVRDTRVCDPIWDVQVIVAVNAKSPLGRKQLNKDLQMELNPSGQGRQGVAFRTGDKVIQLKNGFLTIVSDGGLDSDVITNEKGEVFVANGEFGKVISIEERRLIVEFFNPTRRVAVPLGRREAAGGDSEKPNSKDDDDAGNSGAGDLDLGYCCTAHKMQGSEIAVAIIALDEYPGATGPHGICKREWAYTAISRAKKVCMLVGKMSTLRTMCRDQVLPSRKTFLVERIHEAIEDLKDKSKHGKAAEGKSQAAVTQEQFNGDRKTLPVPAVEQAVAAAFADS